MLSALAYHEIISPFGVSLAGGSSLMTLEKSLTIHDKYIKILPTGQMEQ